jgi:hypothetical protein
MIELHPVTITRSLTRARGVFMTRHAFFAQLCIVCWNKQAKVAGVVL